MCLGLAAGSRMVQSRAQCRAPDPESCHEVTIRRLSTLCLVSAELFAEVMQTVAFIRHALTRF